MISTRILFLSISLFVCASLPAQKLKDKLTEKLQFGGKESTLQDKNVKEISMSVSEKPTLAPGHSFEIGMTAVLDDGKEMKTNGLANGKVKWGNYVVTVKGGSFSNGTVYIENDPRKIPGYIVSVKCALFKDTTVFKSMEFSLNFIANYVADFSGKPGQTGRNGADGQDGAKGSDDLNGRGGNGGNGSQGSVGDRGGDGATGESVDVYVTAFKDAAGTTLLKVYCKSRNSEKEDFFIVNPAGGKVIIYSRGGQGGTGGAGGKGGNGGDGGKGHDYGGNTSDTRYGVGGNGGNGGDGGSGGDGGMGGNGGNVTIYLDPSAGANAGIFEVHTEGGSQGILGSAGGAGGTGSGGNADTRGTQGSSGRTGSQGGYGKPGMNGPKPTIKKEKVTIDWDTVGK